MQFKNIQYNKTTYIRKLYSIFSGYDECSDLTKGYRSSKKIWIIPGLNFCKRKP